MSTAKHSEVVHSSTIKPNKVTNGTDGGIDQKNMESNSSPHTSCATSCLHISRTKKKLLSFFMFASYLQIGMVDLLFGPTLSDMKNKLGVHIDIISFIFTGICFGFLIGAALAGYAIRRMNQQIVVITGTLLVSCMMCIAPYSVSVVMYVAIGFGTGIGLGCVETGCNSVILVLWGTGKTSDKWMQALHFCFSVGALISPLIASPFLSSGMSDHTMNNATTIQTSFMMENVTHIGLDTTPSLNDSIHTVTVLMTYYDKTNDSNGSAIIPAYSPLVHLAFITIAVPGFLIAGVSLVYFRYIKMPLHGLKYSGPETHKKKDGIIFKILIISISSLFIAIYVSQEVVYYGFISVFMVEQFGWNESLASLIPSLLWLSLAVGRLAAIPTAHYLSPSQILTLDIFVMNIATTILIAIPPTSIVVMVCTVVYGLGLSSVFSTLFLWAHRHIDVNGVAAACFLVSGAIGPMAFSPLVGYLYELHSPIWMMYVLFALSVSQFILFVIMETGIYVHNKQSNKLSKSIELDEKYEMDKFLQQKETTATDV